MPAVAGPHHALSLVRAIPAVARTMDSATTNHEGASMASVMKRTTMNTPSPTSTNTIIGTLRDEDLRVPVFQRRLGITHTQHIPVGEDGRTRGDPALHQAGLGQLTIEVPSQQ